LKNERREMLWDSPVRITEISAWLKNSCAILIEVKFVTETLEIRRTYSVIAVSEYSPLYSIIGCESLKI